MPVTASVAPSITETRLSPVTYTVWVTGSTATPVAPEGRGMVAVTTPASMTETPAGVPAAT